MADEVIIPDLPAVTSINTNAMFAVDTGIQTFKMTAGNVATSLKPLAVAPVVAAKTSNFVFDATDADKMIRIDSTAGVFNVTLPNPVTAPGSIYWVKDVAGKLTTNMVTVVRFAAENIEGVAASMTLRTDFEKWGFYTDGTNWWVV